MKAIFLSASVPERGRGEYFKSANPFLIQCAVRELMIAALGRRRIVWGGHPAITPMVWAACEDLGVAYADAVQLYQSRYFEGSFPRDNDRFNNVEYVEAVPGNRDASLLKLRTIMLSRADLYAAVFIGGMEGVVHEYELLRDLRSNIKVIAVAEPGGAARELAISMGWTPQAEDLNFARLFHKQLEIESDEPRAGPGTRD